MAEVRADRFGRVGRRRRRMKRSCNRDCRMEFDWECSCILSLRDLVCCLLKVEVSGEWVGRVLCIGWLLWEEV